MQTNLIAQPIATVAADALVILLFEDEGAPAEMSALEPWLQEMKTSGEFLGKTGEMGLLPMPQGFAAKRLAVAGGGKRSAFDAPALRRAVGTAVRALKGKGVAKLALWMGGSPTAAELEAAVEGAIL